MISSEWFNLQPTVPIQPAGHSNYPTVSLFPQVKGLYSSGTKQPKINRTHPTH